MHTVMAVSHLMFFDGILPGKMGHFLLSSLHQLWMDFGSKPSRNNDHTDRFIWSGRDRYDMFFSIDCT